MKETEGIAIEGYNEGLLGWTEAGMPFDENGSRLSSNNIGMIEAPVSAYREERLTLVETVESEQQ